MSERVDSVRATGPALEAMYQFMLWLVPTVEKFPRSQKFPLLTLNEGQTTGGAYAGFRVRDVTGISVGLDGFYRRSSNINGLGGEVDVALPLLT